MLHNLNFNTRQKPLYVVSDPHFRHDRDFIWGKRGHKSVTEMDAYNEKQWNGTVEPDANVLCLGDFIFNDGKGEHTRKYFKELNGHIYLLWGNHNSGVKQVYYDLMREQFGRVDIEVYPLTYENKVTFVGEYVQGYVDGQPYVASHFPFHIWDAVGHGTIALSGHSHGGDAKSNPDCLECKRLDCGIENLGGPVPWADIMSIMDKKGFTKYDHHDHKTT